MFSAFRNRFGIPGVISVFALVFAMIGGAYAANNPGGGSGPNASASAKGKQGPRGKTGKTGKTGPAGAQGPAGPAGAQGPAGANGKDGSNGGSGQSVTGTSFTGSKGGCTEGGVEFASASGTSFACNGKKGTNGAPGTEGSPWTAGGVLPPGKTETGSWSFGTVAAGAVPADNKMLHMPISFTFPLPGPLDEAHAHYINTNGKKVVYNVIAEAFEEVVIPDCPGTAAAPAAAPGNLCVYAAFAVGAWNLEPGNLIQAAAPNEFSPGGASTGGADFLVFPAAGDSGRGTWAVTAPAAP